MRFFYVLATLGWLSLSAQEKAVVEEFSIDSVIHPVVAQLKPPQWYPEIVSWDPAVTASSKNVQKRVSQGMALIHAGWDFEAYRHFVEAIKEDPNCLMAYWGIALSLANPNSEVRGQRIAAVERMVDLVRQGAGTASERGQTEALAFIFSELPERAPEVFAAVAADYPNHLQLQLMAAYLKRDGYDDLLGPGPGQRAALEEVESILAQNRHSQIALSFWIELQIEDPDATGTVRERILPRVRLLAGLAPDFPVYRERLGHFEKRSGNLLLAKFEFEQAISFYEEKMKADGYSYYDCPHFIRAKLSLANVLQSLGKFEEAMAIAKELAEMPIETERLYSPGATLLLWEGRTLGARLCLAKGGKEFYQRGIQSLPAKKEGQELALQTPSVMAWEAWRHALSARLATATQSFEAADQYIDALAASDGLLSEVRPIVSQGSSRQSWERTRNALKVEWMLAKAVNIEAKSKDKTTSLIDFWYQSAVDERESPKGIFPPLSLSLPPVERAVHFAKQGKNEDAEKIFKMALIDYANDVQALTAYESWLRQSENVATADKIKKHIQVVIGQ